MDKIKRFLYGGLGAFLLAYFLVFLFKGDYEFLIYVVVTGIVLGLVWFADKKYNFNTITVSVFGLWIVLQ